MKKSLMACVALVVASVGLAGAAEKVQSGLEKGAKTAGRETVASVTMAQVEEIAQTKLKDLNTDNLESAKLQVAGTARSMGISVGLLKLLLIVVALALVLAPWGLESTDILVSLQAAFFGLVYRGAMVIVPVGVGTWWRPSRFGARAAIPWWWSRLWSGRALAFP